MYPAVFPVPPDRCMSDALPPLSECVLSLGTLEPAELERWLASCGEQLARRDAQVLLQDFLRLHPFRSRHALRRLLDDDPDLPATFVYGRTQRGDLPAASGRSSPTASPAGSATSAAPEPAPAMVVAGTPVGAGVGISIAPSAW